MDKFSCCSDCFNLRLLYHIYLTKKDTEREREKDFFSMKNLWSERSVCEGEGGGGGGEIHNKKKDKEKWAVVKKGILSS